MRINILQGAFLPVPPVRGGAIEKAWQLLGEAFVRAGHEVYHFSRLCDHLPEKEEINGVHHFRIKGADAVKHPALLKIKEFAYVWRARKLIPEGDILVTHSFWAPILFPKIRMGKIYVHVGRFPKGQLRYYSRAARLQVPTLAIAKAAADELPDKFERVKVLPYPLSNPARGVQPFSKRTKQVLFAGRIHPEKGIHVLVQAWKLLPDCLRKEWQLKIIGPWREAQGGAGYSYLKKIKELGGKEIEVCEPVFDPNELMKNYQSSQIFVYPSLAERGETFGLAALEAMSAGCVPIVSSLSCFRDFIKHHENGFIFNHDTDKPELQLLVILEDLLSNKKLEPYGKKALMTATDYEADKVATGYLDDFRSVLNR